MDGPNRVSMIGWDGAYCDDDDNDDFVHGNNYDDVNSDNMRRTPL